MHKAEVARREAEILTGAEQKWGDETVSVCIDHRVTISRVIWSAASGSAV